MRTIVRSDLACVCLWGLPSPHLGHSPSPPRALPALLAACLSGLITLLCPPSSIQCSCNSCFIADSRMRQDCSLLRACAGAAGNILLPTPRTWQGLLPCPVRLSAYMWPLQRLPWPFWVKQCPRHFPAPWEGRQKMEAYRGQGALLFCLFSFLRVWYK